MIHCDRRARSDPAQETDAAAPRPSCASIALAKLEHPLMLIVLDGWGYSDDPHHNAIEAAATPVWDGLWSDCTHTLVSCSGTDVGLPDRQMGNSEVGHMHIGAGRLIDQDFSRIGKAIASGEFERNPALAAACRHAAETGTALHVLGLASPGGVHSHEDHIVAVIRMAHAAGVSRILVHAFLDGRDTPPRSAAPTLERLEETCATLEGARVASIAGRYFAMDRNNNWDRTALAYDLLTRGEAGHTAASASEALAQAYARDESDEFVTPTVVTDAAGGTHVMADGDVVIFCNFRADRARQMTAALTDPAFDGFERSSRPALGAFVTMTDYGEQFALPIAFPAEDLPHTFGAVVAEAGLRQLRIAETEKYAHVTFFFNGGEERAFEGEDRVLIPSPDVPTYDLQPEMSAAEVTDALVDALGRREYDVVICNFANADMVGHTGNFDATVRCIETLDTCLGRVVDAARAHGTEVLITADHGNAEKMRAGDDAPHTAHTSNLVPLVYVGRDARAVPGGTLRDLAPTMLYLMGLEAPAEMTGRPLLELTGSEQDAA